MDRWTSLAAFAVVLTALTACGQPVGSVADTRSLTTSAALLPGDACQYGGQQILTGVDLNGNGTLEADEIQQLSNICADAPAACTAMEDYTVGSAADWASLVAQGCTSITGTLTIAAPGVVSFDQASPLEHIGILQVYGNDALTSLSFPSLATVEGGVRVFQNAALAELSLPALTSAGGLEVFDDPVLVTVQTPALAAISNNFYYIWFARTPAVAALSFPALVDAGYALTLEGLTSLATLELPALRTVGRLGLGVPSLTTLQLPSLTTAYSIGISFEMGASDANNFRPIDTALTEVVAPVLSQVNSLYIYQATKLTRLELPALASVQGSLVMNNPGGYMDGDTHITYLSDPGVLPALSLPSLTSVGGSFTVNGQAALTTLEAPLLATAGDLWISANDLLREVALPELTEMRRGTLGDGTIRVNANPALVTLDLPKVTSASQLEVVANPLLSVLNVPAVTLLGQLRVTMNGSLTSLSLPLLDRAWSDVSVTSCGALTELNLPAATNLVNLVVQNNPALTELNLPATTTLGALVVQDDAALTSVQLPALPQIGSLLVKGNAALTSLGLPALTQVTRGDFKLDGNANLASLSLPLLAEVNYSAYGIFTIINHPLLTTLNLPQLSRVTGGFNVYGDPLLPNCQAQALFDRLAYPKPTPVNIGDNDMTAFCP